MTKELLSGSVFRLLRQWRKLRVIREKETIIRVRYADAETAAALGFAKGGLWYTPAPAIWTAKTGWCC